MLMYVCVYVCVCLCVCVFMYVFQMVKALSSLTTTRPVALVSCEQKSSVVVMLWPQVNCKQHLFSPFFFFSPSASFYLLLLFYCSFFFSTSPATFLLLLCHFYFCFSTSPFSFLLLLHFYFFFFCFSVSPPSSSFLTFK